ncbi:MAG: hypothetical protein CMH57_14675 [Myxococcales bacterium]|nr:hypothetical protein [Myxococcales bacterium]
MIRALLLAHLLTVASAPAQAEPIDLPGAPPALSPAPGWDDPDLTRAREQFEAKRWSQAARLLDRAMARIRRQVTRDVQRADRLQVGPKQGPGPLKGLSQRYLQGSRPLLIVHADRFYFTAELLRMKGWAAAMSGDHPSAALAWLQLIRSGQATDADLAQAREVARVSRHPALDRALQALDAPAR